MHIFHTPQSLAKACRTSVEHVLELMRRDKIRPVAWAGPVDRLIPLFDAETVNIYNRIRFGYDEDRPTPADSLERIGGGHA